MTKCFALVVLLLLLSGCHTVFYGAAKVSKGPRGCTEQCDTWGMDLAGMVAMGEYSDGCICQVRGQASKAPVSVLSGAGPAIAGVWMQMQRAQQQQHASTTPPVAPQRQSFSSRAAADNSMPH